MKKALFRILSHLTGNPHAQKMLARNIQLSQLLMGIGAGTGVAVSGETALALQLRRRHAAAGRTLCIFDVGANQGAFLDLIAGHLKDVPYQVHAFEPSRPTFQLLAEKAGRRPNLVLNNTGLGKEPGVFTLFYDQPGSGFSSLTQRRLDHLGIDMEQSEQVTIETLDAYCAERAVEQIDLLKIDVEGHEMDVLQGGLEMFREGRVSMVSFEFGGCDIDTRTFFQDFWYFFKENGKFDLFRITPTGFLMPLRAYREEYEQFRTTNFLAVKPKGH